MKSIFTSLIILVSLNVFSQNNLVPNASFENYDTCPNMISQISRTIGWFQPTAGTPDYFNSCSPQFTSVPANLFGDQNARTGNAYSGLCAYQLQAGPLPPYREYIEAKLTSSLVQGQKYYVSFYVSLGDFFMFSTDDIGVAFSIDSLLNSALFLISVTPDIENPSGQFISDKLNWTKVSGEFVAQGGEEFITIGNFKDDINTDTMDVSGGAGGLPLSYYYIDDVCVSTDSLTCNGIVGITETDRRVIGIFPNPFDDVITINAKNSGTVEFILYDYKASIVLSKTITSSEYINTPTLSHGIYFYQVRKNNQLITSGKLLKY